jgi:adenine/guanine phosphoribosyltransferase-like PRPP-binding protein
MDGVNREHYRERLIPAGEMSEMPAAPYKESCPFRLSDGNWVDLPFLPLPPEFNTAIAFLCSNQTSFELCDLLTTHMAELAREFDPEVVIGMPTLGMVYGSRVAEKLGHTRYVPLGYSRKFWYEEELSVPVCSITSPTKPKTVYIDPRLLERMRGKRVILVDDVVSSGGSLHAQILLCEKLGVNLVGIVVANKETADWQDKLAEIDPKYAAMVRAPMKYPLFRKTNDGLWEPDLSTLPTL